MACSLDKIKSDSLREVRKKIKGKSNVVSFTKNGDALITPSSSSAKVKTKANARRMAENKVKAINKWSKDTFGTDAYTGQWLSISEGPNDFRLAITFPKSLERDYQKKIARDEARQQQMEDAERAGIEYDDRYMFDDLPQSADGYNYGLYLDNKQKMKDYFSQRIAVLSEMSNKTKKDFEQIAEFKEIVRRLNQDIKHLEKEDTVLQNFFNYFHRDLDTVEEILLENPTLDNLMGARNFIDMMMFVYDFEKENRFSDAFYQTLDDSTKEIFQRFKNRLETLDDNLKAKELDFAEKGIKAILDNKKTDDSVERDVKRLKDKVGNVAYLSAWLTPIDSDTEASPLQVFVRKVYDDAVGKKETFNLRQKLKNVQKTLEEKLKKDGHDNKKGILGILYSPVDYSIFKRKTAKGRNRLIGKYSNKWFSLQDRVNMQFSAIEKLTFKRNKDVEDFTKIKQLRRKIFSELKANEVKFIDVRYVPEFIDNEDLQTNFGNFFKSREEAEQYKESLIQSLIGESGNRAVAEKLYKEAVEQQLAKLYDFEISVEQYTKRLYKQHGVDKVSDLPEKDRNNLLSMYYTNSPFAFAESYQTSGTSNVTKLYYKDGEQKASVDAHTMEHITYLPSQKIHFDEKFEKEIASDETMYKAWEMFSDALQYINRNRKYSRNYNETEFDDTLTYELDMVHKHSDSVTDLAKYHTKDLLNRVAGMISTSKYKDKSKLKLNGTISSFDEVVRKRARSVMAVVNASGVKKGNVKKETIKKDLIEFLEKKFNTKIPNVVNLADFVKEHTEQEVLNEQNLNLIDTLTNQLEIVEKFKAKKEIETMLLFAKNQIKRVEKLSDKPEDQKHAAKLVESFISRHLYDANNRANWNYYQQHEKKIARLFSTHEQEIRSEIKLAIANIKELSKNGSPEVQKQAEKDIAELQAFMDSQGRVITTGSVFEAGLIRLNILVGLGLNVPSQIKNWLVGNLAGRQNDGLEWTEGNFVKAASYVRKWKIARRKLNPNERANHRLTNTLINNLGIFQNSANELDKIQESEYKNKLKKFVSNPLHIVGEMEKTIQRPQILAKFGDIMIKDKDGNEVPAFDVNNMNENPHPAFELDSDGNLKLKEEFDTEENRSTWIERNSQQYANLFGNSGVLPSMIARMNGDYRDTSTIGIKETSIGSLAMMFKTWLPAFILRRYGKKDGVISNLAESGRGSEAFAASAITASLYAGIGAGILFSPLIGIGIGASILGVRKFRQTMAQDSYTVANLFKEIQKTVFSLKFATNMVRYTGGTGVKMLQQQTDLIFGKRFISNDIIGNITGVKQMEGESDAEFEKNKARLQFLVTEAATTLQLLILKVLANAMLFPDDDERDEFNKAKGFDKIAKQPDVYMYFFLENMLTGFSDDMNLANDPFQLTKNVLAGSSADGYNKGALLVQSMGDQLMKGDYQRGENAGKNRIAVNMGKMFVPKGMFDLSLGFYRTGQRDYRPKDPINVNFLTNFKAYEDERIKQRSNRKEELIEQYQEQYPNWDDDRIEKRVQKQLGREFPTIKKHFNPDGSIKFGRERAVEKYE